MANKSREWYIENNDFEGAVERLESTNATWKGRWYEVCEQIFNSCKEWAKEYVLDPIGKAVHKVGEIITKRRTKYNSQILVSSDCKSLFDNAKQKCYLFEFFDENDKHICSKVGTTTRTVRKRLTEELNNDTYTKLGAVKAIIHRVFDCGDIPAEGLESYFRAMYIRKYPNSFKKNDRFMNLKFDLNEADKIAEKYLEKA